MTPKQKEAINFLIEKYSESIENKKVATMSDFNVWINLFVSRFSLLRISNQDFNVVAIQNNIKNSTATKCQAIASSGCGCGGGGATTYIAGCQPDNVIAAAQTAIKTTAIQAATFLRDLQNGKKQLGNTQYVRF